MRRHWDSCITHQNGAVDTFIKDYFDANDRRVLLVAGAGFDPRSRKIAEKLQAALGGHLVGFLVREERGDPAENLRQAADENQAMLTTLIQQSHVVRVRVFDEIDGAPVGGQRIAGELAAYQWPEGLTDIVLDVSALSTGIAFPIARYLLDHCESREGLNFHIMISSNPELDARIVGEPYGVASHVRGFSGALSGSAERPIARIWLPQLARGRTATLEKIRAAQGHVYKVCPILPFPARDPRRADDLIAEFMPMIIRDGIDARDFIYVSEHNPLDFYRKLATLKKRYDRTVEDIYEPELVLSPVGSKVMAVGAMMAAIEHGMPVQHVENLRYDYDPSRPSGDPEQADMTVHIWLHGPIYAGYQLPGINA